MLPPGLSTAPSTSINSHTLDSRLRLVDTPGPVLPMGGGISVVSPYLSRPLRSLREALESGQAPPQGRPEPPDSEARPTAARPTAAPPAGGLLGGGRGAARAAGGGGLPGGPPGTFLAPRRPFVVVAGVESEPLPGPLAGNGSSRRAIRSTVDVELAREGAFPRGFYCTSLGRFTSTVATSGSTPRRRATS